MPVRLAWGENLIEVPAKLDTGAASCIFKRGVGEALDISIENGLRQVFSTATGEFVTYGHEIILATPGFESAVLVYFAQDWEYPRNVLGRQGWLDKLRVGIVDYDRHFYVSGYDDDNS